MQRIGIARALYENKEILIFDEATNALDETLERSLILKILEQKKDKILIFVTHNESLLQNFDKIYKIKDSKLFEEK